VSIRVLESLIGKDEVEAMDPAEISRLCDAIDAEILKDEALQGRLLEAVQSATRPTPGSGRSE
jgi:hypothetical protein